MGTICVGHILTRVMTEHFSIEAPSGPWDERLVEIHPYRPKEMDSPTQPFTDEGPGCISVLHARWRMGKKADKIKNL